VTDDTLCTCGHPRGLHDKDGCFAGSLGEWGWMQCPCRAFVSDSEWQRVWAAACDRCRAGRCDDCELYVRPDRKPLEWEDDARTLPECGCYRRSHEDLLPLAVAEIERLNP
jgi:hypothetical protein